MLTEEAPVVLAFIPVVKLPIIVFPLANYCPEPPPALAESASVTILNAGTFFGKECQVSSVYPMPFPSTGECAAGTKMRLVPNAGPATEFEISDHVPPGTLATSSMVAFITFNKAVDVNSVRKYDFTSNLCKLLGSDWPLFFAFLW